MEASGGYERAAHRWLSERGLEVTIVNATRVRDFARASSLLAKTDRLDAVIAPWRLRPGRGDAAGDRPAEALAELLAYRRQLTVEITARIQQLGHHVTSALRQRQRQRSRVCSASGRRSRS